jgi:hypothetical protein
LEKQQQDFLDKFLSHEEEDNPDGEREECRLQENFLVKEADTFRFKMDCCEQRKMWRGFERILDEVYCTGDDPEQLARRQIFSDLAKQYSAIFQNLNLPEDKETLEVDALQLDMDSFCRLFNDSFGRKQESSYIHCMASAHFAFFLHEYGSLYKLQNVGLEGLVKVVRTFIQNGTQHSGHSGNQPTRGRLIASRKQEGSHFPLPSAGKPL